MTFPPAPEGINFSTIEVKKAVRDKKLLLLMLDLSWKCDLRCIYCFNNAGKKRKDEMSLDEYISVIDQAIELGVKTVMFAGAGEPLLDDKLFPLVEYCCKKSLIPIVFTHGASLNEKVVSFFIKNNVTLGVKINSFLPHVQDHLVGVNWYTEKRNRSISIIQKLKYAERFDSIKLWLDSLILKSNIREIPLLFTWARENNWWPGINTVLYQGRAQKLVPKEEVPSENELKSVFEKLRKIDSSVYGYKWKALPPYVGWYCNIFPISLKVEANGDVRKCFSYPVVGSIKEKKLSDLWFSEEVQNMNMLCEYKEYDGFIYYGCPPRKYLKLTNNGFNKEKAFELSLKFSEKAKWKYYV